MDKNEAYEFLYRLAEALSLMFGKNCETIIHEIDGQHILNLAIFNGHVSNRKAGSTLSIYGRDTTLDDDSPSQNLELDYLNQQVIVSGKQIKSTTIHMRGSDYHYALGINYDISVLSQMQRIMDGLTAVEDELSTRLSMNEQPEIAEIFDSCLENFSMHVDLMKKSDRIELVRQLQDKGAFHIQRSVPYVAERLGITKFTVYNYLNEINNE